MPKQNNPKYLYSYDQAGNKTRRPNPDYNPDLSSSASKSTTPKSQDFLNQTEPVSIVVERLESDQVEQKPLRGEKQYRDFLLQSLGVTSLLLALIICYFASLPSFLAEELALTTEEVEMFAQPGARLLAKSKLPEGVRTGLINSGDYVGLGTAAIVYIYRVLETMRTFKEHTVNDYPRQTQGLSTPPAAAGNGTYNTTANAGVLAGWGNFAAG